MYNQKVRILALTGFLALLGCGGGLPPTVPNESAADLLPLPGDLAVAQTGDMALVGDLAAMGKVDDLAGSPSDLAGSPPGDLAVSSVYPAGPYGISGSIKVGDVLPDLTFNGYWNPQGTTGLASEKPFGAITFNQLRLSGAKYALIALLRFW